MIKAPPAPVERIHVSKGHSPAFVFGVQEKIPVRSDLREITVVITSFKRQERLLAAFKSCLRAGVRNIVVSGSGSQEEDDRMFRRISEMYPAVIIDAINGDLGCNETWIRGVRLAKTKWVHILHDDDLILPEFFTLGNLLTDLPAPFYHWNAQRHGAGYSGISETFRGLKTGVYSSDILWPRLLNGLSLSPVSGLFQRDHLISVLDECERAFLDKKHFLRPGMMVGNDLMIWLRAVENYPKFCFVREPLISYGHWDGSATYDDVFNKRNRLPALYDAARSYYLTGPEIESDRWLVHIRPAFGKGTPAVDFATKVWCNEHLQGPWISQWIHDSAMPRLFADDRRNVPFLKDMIEAGMDGQPDSSVFVISNSDVIPCEGFTRLLAQAFQTHECAYCYRRDVNELRIFSPAEIRTNATVYSGLDLFAFTKAWWEDHSPELPDLLFATELWDYCLQLLMAKHGGKKFQYLIYHLRHEPEGVRNRDSKSQRFNRMQAEPFLKENNGFIYWKVNDPKETSVLNPR